MTPALLAGGEVAAVAAGSIRWQLWSVDQSSDFKRWPDIQCRSPQVSTSSGAQTCCTRRSAFD